MASTTEALETALTHHQAGQWREAEQLYRQVLADDELQPEALHFLGILLSQQGRHDQAIHSIQQAIGVRGDQPLYLYNLGEALLAAGRPAEAVKAYRSALALAPDLPHVHRSMAEALALAGDRSGAIAAYERAVQLAPHDPEPLEGLGSLLFLQDQAPAAVQRFRQALALQPDSARTNSRLGAALILLGNLDEAAEAFRRATELAPEVAEFHVNLGTAYHQQTDYARAATSLREATRLDPHSALAFHNLGETLKFLHQFEDAAIASQQAIALNPRLAEAHLNLALVYGQLNRFPEAVDALHAALQIRPDFKDALITLGNYLIQHGRLDEAREIYERAKTANPEMAMVHYNLGIIHHMQDRLEEAIDAYCAAMRLKQSDGDVFNNLSVALYHSGQLEAAVDVCQTGLTFAPEHGPMYATLASAVEGQGRGPEALVYRRKSVQYLPSDAATHSNLLYSLVLHSDLDQAAIFAEHEEWGRRHANPLTALAVPHANDRTPNRRLRVGYVSSFFRNHAVNFFVEPLLSAHDHDQVEVFCYSHSKGKDDQATERVKKYADHWHEVSYLGDDEVAEKIRQDQIDILIDLAGHIGDNRLMVFARKPAPIQVTYLGYQHTTGMAAMDYRFTDAHADPVGLTDAYYSEKLERLPRAFFCYRPEPLAPEVTPLPALARGYVTFGAFNNFVKVTSRVLDAWMRILTAVPDSRLSLLAFYGGHIQRHVIALAEERGIDPKRIEFQPKRLYGPYLELLSESDIGLDPFPFIGHTTTCDCVWMGVPVVTLEGQTYASRFGGSVHRNVGLEDWIATDVDQYVEIAIAKAQDLDGLARLRQQLRVRMAASALLDFKGFAVNVEQAYREMWARWCQGS